MVVWDDIVGRCLGIGSEIRANVGGDQVSVDARCPNSISCSAARYIYMNLNASALGPSAHSSATTLQLEGNSNGNR